MFFKKKAILFLGTVFNWYFDFYTGGKTRPVFFNKAETCKELSLIDNNYALVKEELEKLLLRSEEIPKYHEVDQLQYTISAIKNPEKSWKTFMLFMMGGFAPSAVDKCPATCLLLKKIPGLYQSFFSILDPKKEIPAHKGLYRGYLRYHLGMIIPEHKPPSIRIKDQHYTWIEKESILFDDSWEHEVFNQCENERVVLVVDIYRPMPYFPARVNHLVTKHLIKRFYADKVLKKLMF